MNDLLDSTVDLLLSGLMGLFGGLVTLPINAAFSWWLKREEQQYQHRLDMIAKQRELLLQHKLETQRTAPQWEEISELKAAIARLEQRIDQWTD